MSNLDEVLVRNQLSVHIDIMMILYNMLID